MVDMDAAIGFVVAHGDAVDRARLSYLRTGSLPADGVLIDAEIGQARNGGWPATWNGSVASVDATCFRLRELDDLGALDRPAARAALDWLASRQRSDGSWEEDEALAGEAPPWARPGDPEAILYLTTNAAFWLAASGLPGYGEPVEAAARLIAGHVGPDGSWPSFLISGWLGAAVLYHQGAFYESARLQIMLGERLSRMSAADVAAMAAAMRRTGLSTDDHLLVMARRRLAETQRTDGGWPSDDGQAFDVHTTLTAIRATR